MYVCLRQIRQVAFGHAVDWGPRETPVAGLDWRGERGGREKQGRLIPYINYAYSVSIRNTYIAFPQHIGYLYSVSLRENYIAFPSGI